MFKVLIPAAAAVALVAFAARTQPLDAFPSVDAPFSARVIFGNF